MTPDAWSDRLSDHLDGHLDAAERAGVDAHLATCADCRRVRADLERVRSWAAAFDPRDADADAGWPELRVRLAGARHPHRRARGLPALRAAAAVVVVLAGLLWLARRPPVDADGVPSASFVGLAGLLDTSGVSLAHQAGELERLLQERGDELSPETLAAVGESLRAIENALARVRGELARDPDNALLLELERRSNLQKVRVLAHALTTPRA